MRLVVVVVVEPIRAVPLTRQTNLCRRHGTLQDRCSSSFADEEGTGVSRFFRFRLGHYII
jgi:hypothetical protein